MLQALVIDFNQRVLKVEPKPTIALQDPDAFRLSLAQMREELDEMENAYEQGDLIGVIDGLIDLDYFHKGVVYKHGIGVALYNELFVAVHEANMEKKLGVNHNRPGFNGAADAVKPEGWLPPEDRLRAIINLQS